jgi:excisionase family DNA binding protein
MDSEQDNIGAQSESEKPLLLKVAVVCKLLSRSRARVYELVKTGELEGIVDECGPRGRILIPRDAVEQWIKIQRRKRTYR